MADLNIKTGERIGTGETVQSDPQIDAIALIADGEIIFRQELQAPIPLSRIKGASLLLNP